MKWSSFSSKRLTFSMTQWTLLNLFYGQCRTALTKIDHMQKKSRSQARLLNTYHYQEPIRIAIPIRICLQKLTHCENACRRQRKDLGQKLELRSCSERPNFGAGILNKRITDYAVLVDVFTNPQELPYCGVLRRLFSDPYIRGIFSEKLTYLSNSHEVKNGS